MHFSSQSINFFYFNIYALSGAFRRGRPDQNEQVRSGPLQTGGNRPDPPGGPFKSIRPGRAWVQPRILNNC
jgi:hypothetical protein